MRMEERQEGREMERKSWGGESIISIITRRRFLLQICIPSIALFAFVSWLWVGKTGYKSSHHIHISSGIASERLFVFGIALDRNGKAGQELGRTANKEDQLRTYFP